MKISVVIAAYNEEKLIAKCIEAVKNQTYPKKDYEILVIDNNSTDKTAQIAKKLGAKVIPYKKEQGFSVTKQFGAKQAKGKIIAITDADSIPDKHWLEKIEKVMQNKDLVCVGGPVLSTEDTLVSIPFVIYDSIFRINQLFGISLIWGPNMAVRRDAFMQVGGINTKLKTSDDWELILRLQKKFGIRSTLYTKTLHVKTSPQKQKTLRAIIPYSLYGVVNYVSIFILRKSRTYGNPITIR
jgi:glycosyltransferase involved in cell wall biosynthesis